MNYEKEKAIELVDKYLDINNNIENWKIDINIDYEVAKKCALIAINEIINNVYKTPFRFTSVSSDELYRINEECKHSLNRNILFLNLVKKEIEKL